MEAGPAMAVLEREAGERQVGGGFEKAAVSRHECGGREPEYLPEREVPRHHGEDRSDGIEADVALRCIRDDLLGRQISLRVLGVVTAYGRALPDLGHRRADRLPHLQSDRAAVGGSLTLEDL